VLVEWWGKKKGQISIEVGEGKRGGKKGPAISGFWSVSERTSGKRRKKDGHIGQTAIQTREKGKGGKGKGKMTEALFLSL